LITNSATIFNKDWRFMLGDAKNAQSAGFNDRTWKHVDLPHDWLISQPFNQGKKGGWTSRNMQGFFAWEGVCWYRKEFFLKDIKGKTVYIYFGGAYRNSRVFINGKEAGGRACGYSSFELDISALVKEGNNLIAVRLDNGCEETDRWYSGSGLYRNVFLKVLPVTHIKTWGIQAVTELSANKKQAAVSVTTAIVNKKAGGQGSDAGSKGILYIKLLDSSGNIAAESKTKFDFGGKDEIDVKQNITLNSAQSPVKLWSAQEPNLYRLCAHIEIDGNAGEPVEINIGFRTVEIAYNKGMTVNGEPVKLKGVCIHHDSGIAGSAYFDEVWRRRLNTLKSIGCNAVRTSHNPPAQEFLDLCDEMGFYVIDECFDKWKSGYYASHFDTDAQRDLTEFVLRDRNHPCIFMWSVGNEVENQGQDSMIAIQKQLVSTVRSLDSRPVTCALSPHANPRTLVNAPVSELVKLTKKLVKDVDAIGLNYHEPLYEAYTQGIEKPIIGTECYEYYSSVGTNFEDVSDKNPWQFVLENDNVIGQFIWAGIDYLGECCWPAKGWSGSILDICGFMKPNAYFRKTIWSNEPLVYLAFLDQGIKPDYARGRWSFPPLSSHLNHDNLHRKNVTAVVYTNCEEVELWINGKKRGRRKKSEEKNGIIEWYIEYTQGNIEVKGFNSGKEECSYALTTAEKPQKIKLLADNVNLKPGEIAHIEVNVTDAKGVLCRTEDQFIEFSLEGDAQYLGACSPDLNQHLGFTASKVMTSQGKALAIIRAGDGPGNIVLRAYSENLEGALSRFKIK